MHEHGAFEARVAIALIGTRCISASPISTDAVRDAAFIDICAIDAFNIESKSLVALAGKTSGRILAATILADVGEVEAFVDVCYHRVDSPHV